MLVGSTEFGGDYEKISAMQFGKNGNQRAFLGLRTKHGHKQGTLFINDIISISFELFSDFLRTRIFSLKSFVKKIEENQQIYSRQSKIEFYWKQFKK